MSRTTGKILLVEDDNEFRAVLALALELEGFVVRQACDGEMALQALTSEQPDLIISDLDMKGINGRSLCKYARSDEVLSRIPFVVLSAFVDSRQSVTLADFPADCFVSKQVSIAHLVGVIKDLLSGSSRHALVGRSQVIE